MKITTAEVMNVAKLARLNFTEDEVQGFTENMAQILTYVEKLNELDVTGVEPTAHVHDIVNAFRKDEVRPGLSNEQALANAPSEEDGCFKVAKIIEEA
jgi:aspartyl-tRNA(Asn)/glutamyl-tRNA(Gln) amidotransferase subunit C